MFCNTATELLRELKRSKRWLPPYNENAILDISKDVDTSWKYILDHQQNLQRLRAEYPAQRHELPDSISVTTAAQFHSVKRQKRCVLAYLNYRMEKVRNVWWDVGSNLPEELKALLSRQEQAFLSGYDELMLEYMNATDLVLTQDLNPPKDLYVTVRAVKDVGEIQTVNGPLQLDVNSEVSMRRVDAELLIRQGALVQSKRE